MYLAKAKGFFAEQGISVALLSPQDPSDVTEIIGSGKVSDSPGRRSAGEVVLTAGRYGCQGNDPYHCRQSPRLPYQGALIKPS